MTATRNVTKNMGRQIHIDTDKNSPKYEYERKHVKFCESSNTEYKDKLTMNERGGLWHNSHDFSAFKAEVNETLIRFMYENEAKFDNDNICLRGLESYIEKMKRKSSNNNTKKKIIQNILNLQQHTQDSENRIVNQKTIATFASKISHRNAMKAQYLAFQDEKCAMQLYEIKSP